MVKKKSLGQHFLHSAHYLGLVADALTLKKDEVVVEIGPGDGALTKVLLERGAKVISIEKDTRLIPVLEHKFANEIVSKQLTLVEADALEFDVSKYLSKKDSYKVAGNIPYYITGALIRAYLTAVHQPSALVFLIQKEVAERIARSKKESILSLSVKAYGTPRYIKTVPAGAFVPPPKVDSAILLVEDISRTNFKNKKEEDYFFELVKTGFAQKRKLLGSNLKDVLGSDAGAELKAAGIPNKARAEDVPLENWLELLK